MIAPDLSVEATKHVIGNVTARLRMAIAYYWAKAISRLVVGMSNQTERLLGYFPKYGNGGATLLPLGDYYQTEVRTLAGSTGILRE